MNKLSKLTALLLAIVLALGVPLGALAESAEITTKTEYMDIAKEALKTKIMAYETYGEYWDMVKLIEESDFEDFFYTLPLDDQNAIAKYVNDMFWASLVGYTNVAPLPEMVETTESVSTFSLTARDGDSNTTTDNGLYTNKTVSDLDDNGYYTITLENYATGTVTTNTTTEIKPVDIVLVLDDSGSMAWDFATNTSNGFTYTKVDYNSLDKTKTYYVQRNKGGGYIKVEWCASCAAWARTDEDHSYHDTYDASRSFYERSESKGEALITAVNNFVDSVNANSPTEGTHQMSIVKFSGNGNDELLNGWTDVNNDNIGTLKLADGDMDFNGGTYIDDGLTRAKTQLESLTTTGRQRVVIVFTDGIPGSGSWGESDGGEVVGASAINIAKNIKAMPNTTIYTVAVLQGANPNEGVVSPATGNDDKINAILHAISSNYLNVGNVTASYREEKLTVQFNDLNPMVDTNNDEVVQTTEAGYYLSANSPEALNNIFQQISSQIQTGASSVTLDETTIVRDEVTPYFEIPFVYVYETNEDGSFKLDADGNKIPVYETNADGSYVLDENGNKIQKRDYTAAEITIYEAQHTGDDANGNPVFGTPVDVTTTYTPVVDGNVLDVQGFNFAENAVMTLTNNGTTSYVGKKLIITFKIKAVDGFLGGNDVVTNTSNSGIWEQQADGSYTEFEAYPIPNVNVDVPDLEILAANQHIYLGNLADLDELLQSFSVTYNIVDKDTSGAITDRDGEYTVDTILNYYTNLTFYLKDSTAENANILATYTITAGQPDGTWTYNSNYWGDDQDGSEKLLKLKLTEDTPFYITYEAVSANNTTNKSSDTLTAWVYVYTPEVTFQDSVEKYMDTMAEDTAEAYYAANNVPTANVVWKHDTHGTAGAQMSGTEPTLTYVYTPDETWLNDSKQVTATKDVNVTVKTTVTGTGYPNGLTLAEDQIKYYRNKVAGCPDTCTWTSDNESKNNPAFVIHITDVLGELKIIKTGMADGESAIFTVMGPGYNGMVVVPNGNTGVTLYVTCGAYTITEIGDWTWRYSLDSVKVDGVTANLANPVTVDADGTTVEVTNKKDNDKWLSDEDSIVNFDGTNQ